MPTWKFILSYDGSAFHGWQVQPGRPTIQGTLSDAIHRLTGERILPQGSGRTDAGVHALAQVASLSLTAAIPPANLLLALNRMLPPSIRILSADIVPPTFHARHSALRKTYEYRIFERKQHHQTFSTAEDSICPPFLAPFVWDCRWPLHLEAMQQAAAHLLGTHDFTSFAASDPDLTLRANQLQSPPTVPPPSTAGPNPIKTVFSTTLHHEQGLLLFRITGSGFLHHMVRNIVGTLADVGRGALPPTAIPHILAARDRSFAGPTAPANGLFLAHVDYGYAQEAGRPT